MNGQMPQHGVVIAAQKPQVKLQILQQISKDHIS